MALGREEITTLESKAAQVFSLVSHTCGEAENAWRMFAINICEQWFGCSPCTAKNMQSFQKRLKLSIKESPTEGDCDWSHVCTFRSLEKQLIPQPSVEIGPEM